MIKKEENKFTASNIFEGMTSIRAIIEGIDSGVNDRRILNILFDKEKRSKTAHYKPKRAQNKTFVHVSFSPPEQNTL